MAMRRMISRVLTDAQHEVVEAADGRNGIRKVQSEAQEIIGAEIVTPELDGSPILREICASGSAVGIISTTGRGGDGSAYLTIAEELGADAVLQRPFALVELVAVIDRMLSRGSAAK